MFRIVGKLLHPIAQLRHMHAQVLRSLHIGHASLLDQAHSLKFELAGKLPSLHDPPPAPSKHPNSVSSEPGAGHTRFPVRMSTLAVVWTAMLLESSVLFSQVPSSNVSVKGVIYEAHAYGDFS